MNKRRWAAAMGLIMAAGLAGAGPAPRGGSWAFDGAALLNAEPARSTLKVGDAAPELSIESWVKGDEVKSLEKGTVYVVEFWATWCPPCVESIPKLTQIQREFKDRGLVVVGVAASERGAEAQREGKLKDFVAKQGDKMNYRVAFDADRSMAAAWMKAAGQNSIPTAFVVGRDGKIAFIGHPEDLRAAVASAVGAGDPAKPAGVRAGTPFRADFGPARGPVAGFEPGDGKDAAPAPAEKAPAAEKLAVGAAAPALTIQKWVKGEPVTGFEKGKVYVVEFWATWCPPCRESIPHLTKLQKKYQDRGLTIIGISSSDKSLKVVEDFVAKQGDKMEYVVAVDDKRATDKAWMEASGQEGIPTSFVVDQQGKVAWIGHPMSGLDEVVGEVVAGTFDAKAFAEREKKVDAVSEQIGKALGAKEWDRAFGLMDEYSALKPDAAPMVTATKYQILLREKRDVDAAAALASQAADGVAKDDAQLLNAFAWGMVDTPNLPKRDLDLAQRLALRAVELTKSQDASILDTLARVYFDKGEIAEAVKTQKLAVETAPKEAKAELEATLKKYEEKQGK